MKRLFPIIVCITFLIIYPSISFSSYLIELKNGSALITNHYWKEGAQIKFYCRGGIVGITNSFVKRIEKTDADINYKERTDADISHKEKTDAEKKETHVTADLKYYMGEKKNLTVKLNNKLEKLKQATRNKDKENKEKIRDEIRKISADIYNLTNKVKKINNGTLPEGWWEEK